MNGRKSRGRTLLSHSLSLLGAKSWQAAKRNLCIWTSHIRGEKCWTDLQTSKACETDLIFWRGSAEQQKWQSRGAMLQTDCIISTHGNGKTLWIDNKWADQAKHTQLLHRSTCRLGGSCNAQQSQLAVPRGGPSARQLGQGEPDSVATPWWPGLPWDWLILFIRKGEVDYPSVKIAMDFVSYYLKISIQPMSYSLLLALQNNEEQKNIPVKV